MNLEEKRSLWAMAVERLEDLSVQLEHLGANPDPAVRDTLEERFNEAEQHADKCRQDYERAERVASVRALTIPVEDTEDGDKPAEQRQHDVRDLAPRAARVRVGKEEETYRPDNSNGNFFYRDLYRASKADQDARERIQRCRRELLVEKRDLTSTDTAGGDFVSPLYMVNDWINVVRMGRPFANVVNAVPLPDNTDTIIWPKLTSGTATSAQADIGAVQETDPVTTTVSVGVKTVAGQVDVSQQLLDRSQPGIDQILFADLRADYNLRLDLQCLSGSGSGANAKGVLSDTNRTQVTYTDASPTVGELYSKIQDASQRILTARGLPANTIVMSPRRWAWIAAALDSSGRPLITPSGASLNSPGTGAAPVDLGQPGFSIASLNVVVDANLPSNLGAGTNEDVIIVMRREDPLLAERPNPTTRVHDQVLDANLTVRLQLFNYFAFSTERLSAAIATIGGTGLAAPTF